MYSAQPVHNIVRSTIESQGVTHPADLSYQILRDYNVRPVSIENSSPRPIGVSITTYLSGPVPDILFVLPGGRNKFIDINSHGDYPQYLWILDVQTGKPVGSTYPLRSDANSFVLRDGLNKWWVNAFRQASYSPAH